MATKLTRNSTDPTSTEDKAPKRRRTSAKGVLSQKERLETVRKANQALLKALELMSSAQSDI